MTNLFENNEEQSEPEVIILPAPPEGKFYSFFELPDRRMKVTLDDHPRFYKFIERYHS